MHAIVTMTSGLVYAGYVVPSELPNMLQVNLPAKVVTLTEYSPVDPETGVAQQRTVTYTYSEASVVVSSPSISTIVPVSEAEAATASTNYPAGKVVRVDGPWE